MPCAAQTERMSARARLFKGGRLERTGPVKEVLNAKTDFRRSDVKSETNICGSCAKT